MGRTKKWNGEIKPFCYYCEREFENEKILIQHQRVKHLRCKLCNKRMDHSTGLLTHMVHMHKETLTRLENTLPGRESPDLPIHGMEGVPMDLIEKKRQIMRENVRSKEQEKRKLGINKSTFELLMKARRHPRFGQLQSLLFNKPEIMNCLNSVQTITTGIVQDKTSLGLQHENVSTGNLGEIYYFRGEEDVSSEEMRALLPQYR